MNASNTPGRLPGAEEWSGRVTGGLSWPSFTFQVRIDHFGGMPGTQYVCTEAQGSQSEHVELFRKYSGREQGWPRAPVSESPPRPQPAVQPWEIILPSLGQFQS